MNDADIEHGFSLHPQDSEGKASISLLRILPSQIVELSSREPSGATITCRFHEGTEPYRYEVIENTEEIQKLVNYCQHLDVAPAGERHFPPSPHDPNE